MIKEMGSNPEFSQAPELTIEQRRQVKKEFLKPYTDEEIDLVWEDLSRMRGDSLPPDKTILHRSKDGFDYAIHIFHIGDDRLIEFQITDDQKNYLAKVIFKEQNYPSGRWDLNHRLVELNQLQVSGTEFLEQSEEYLRILNEKNYLAVNEFVASTSQVGVIKWLIKNGYEFSTAEDEELFDDMNQHPKDYDHFYIANGQKYIEDPYYFKRSEVDIDEITKHLDPRYTDLKHITGLGSRWLTNIKGLARVHLKKELESELAKDE